MAESGNRCVQVSFGLTYLQLDLVRRPSISRAKPSRWSELNQRHLIQPQSGIKASNQWYRDGQLQLLMKNLYSNYALLTPATSLIIIRYI